MNALNIGYILSIFKYIKMPLIQIKSLNTVEHVFLPLRYQYSIGKALCCSLLLLSSVSFVQENYFLVSCHHLYKGCSQEGLFQHLFQNWWAVICVSAGSHISTDDWSNLWDNSWLSDLNLMEVAICYLEF